MDYWAEAIDEAIDATSLDPTEKERKRMGEIIAGAANVETDYCGKVVDPSPLPTAPVESLPHAAWWQDRSQLVGQDWLLSGQIHALINSRYS